MALVIEEINAHSEEKTETDFTFHFLPEATFDCMGGKKNQEKLMQWGLSPDMHMIKFRYDQQLQRADLPAFVHSFFAGREGQGMLRQLGGCVLEPKKVKVRMEELTAKQVSLAFLRQLETAGCISQTGHIRGRLEEDYEGVPMWDLVREAMVMEESELYDAFSTEDRKELLFHIFQRLVLGGAMNQYEEYVEPYTALTKEFYRDLATVRKNAAGDVEVLSWVVQVHDIGPGGALFPKMEREKQNFCYLIIDPVVRHVTLWYWPYKSHWG
jgi:hypothetical protein